MAYDVAISMALPFSFHFLLSFSTCFLCFFFKNCSKRFVGCRSLLSFGCRRLLSFTVSVADSGESPFAFLYHFPFLVPLLFAWIFPFKCLLLVIVVRVYAAIMLLSLLFGVRFWLCCSCFVFRQLNVFGFGARFGV